MSQQGLGEAGDSESGYPNIQTGASDVPEPGVPGQLQMPAPSLPFG